MAIGELKLHITACGFKELEHLLEVLMASIDTLPVNVTEAFWGFVDSAPASEEAANG